MVDQQKLQEIEIQEYSSMIQKVKPKPQVFKHAVWAFVIGGLVCVLAQIIVNSLVLQGMSTSDASSSTAVIMIFLAALLTGLGYYDELAKYAGAGTIVPITGFANAIVASALEFKREGYIFGVGARIFAVAGPTLVFGFAVSTLIGLIKVFLGS